MPSFHNLQIPPPSNWQDFESLCCDLWKDIWKDPDTQKNGRKGQAQKGVDIYGRPNKGKFWGGVQCKLKSADLNKNLTESEVCDEIEKAKNFKPELSEFVIATTGLKDAKIEELARKITKEHQDKGLFSVSVWSWEDIKNQLSPELLNKHYPKFSVNLVSQEDISRFLNMAPDLEDYFVERPYEFEQLKTNLLEKRSDKNIAITTALRGAGGYGKTTLANALCHDKDIINEFPDGIFWVTLGEEPQNLNGIIEDLIYFISHKKLRFENIDASTLYLKNILVDKKLLLVIDDVWNEAHLKPFLQGGTKCARLITTRDDATLPPNAVKIPVDAMKRPEAVELLGFNLTFEKDDVLHKLAKRLGNWPLLLKLVNATLRLRVDVNENIDKALNYVDEALTEEGLTVFDMENPQSRDQAVEATLNVSIRALNENERNLYSELAIFPEDAKIPLQTLEKLWNITGNIKPYHVRKLCGKFYRMSLLHTYNARSEYIIIHDIIRSYLVTKHKKKLPGIHSQFLDNYKLEKWTNLSKNEPYLWINLAYHLYESDRTKELRDLLLNFDWLQSKLEITSVSSLIDDYNFFPQDSTLQLIKGTMRLSASALILDKEQLAGQLLGRLKSFQNDEIRSIILEIIDRDKNITKLLPVTGTLCPPGGSLVSNLVGHSSGIRDVAVTKDGHYIISASDDRTIKVWEFNTGKEVRTLKERPNYVNTIAVAPNEEYLVSVSADNTLKIRDFESGMLIKKLTGYTGAKTAVITPNSKYVIAASNDHTLRVLDLKTGNEIRKLKLHSTRVCAVAITFEGKFAVSASEDSTIKIWDVESGREIRKINAGSAKISSLAITPNEKYIISASGDRRIKVFGFKDGKEIRILEGHSSGAREVAVTPDSERVISASNDREIKVWDIETGKEFKPLKGHSSSVRAIRVTENGKYLISGSSDGILKIWNLKNEHEIQSTKGHSSDTSVVTVTPDNIYAISASYDNTLKVWEIESGNEIHMLEGHSARISSIAVTPDSKYVVSASYDTTLKVWEIENGKLICTLKGHSARINSVVVTQDGRYAISASDDKTLKVWETGSWRRIHTLEGHLSKINSVAVTPDSLYIISASDHTLKVWGTENWKEIHTLEGHLQEVTGIVVYPEGKYIVSVSKDRTLILWEVKNGKKIASFSGDTPLTSSCISSNGSTIVVGEASGSVHILRVCLRVC